MAGLWAGELHTKGPPKMICLQNLGGQFCRPQARKGSARRGMCPAELPPGQKKGRFTCDLLSCTSFALQGINQLPRRLTKAAGRTVAPEVMPAPPTLAYGQGCTISQHVCTATEGEKSKYSLIADKLFDRGPHSLLAKKRITFPEGTGN